MARNAEIVRGLYDAFNRSDTDAARELMDPAIEWVNPEDAVEPGTRHGFAEYQHALGRVREIFREATIEVDRLEESGDRIAADIRMHAHLNARGMDTAMRQSHLWTLRGGKATRFEWFTDPQLAFERLESGPSGTPRG